MTRNRPLIYTAFNSAATFVLGLVTAQKGPSFNDLILISKTDVEGGSFYVTASNFGFMMGSLLAGTIYGRIQTKSMTIAIAMMFSGLLTSLVPLCTVFPAMLFMQAFVSVCTSIYETTVSAEEIEAWDGSSESAMQFLSFCGAIGAVISPLITRPFLAPKATHVSGKNESSFPSASESISSIPKEFFLRPDNDSLDIINTKSDVQCPGLSSNCTNSLEEKLTYNVSTIWDSSNHTLQSDDITSNLQYAYLITGASSIVLSILFYAFFIQAMCTSRKRVQKKKDKKPVQAKREIPRATSVKLVALVSAFYLFYAMGLDSFVQYLFYFLVTHLDWSNTNSAYLMSLYYALGIPMKLLMVVMYKRVKVGNVLLLCHLGIVAFVVLFIFASQFHIHALVWVACSGMAISQATTFSGGFAWTDGNLIPVNGRVTGVLMVFTCLGALTAPLLLGVLMKHLSLMYFPYCVLIQVSTSTTIFLIMLFVVKPAMDRKYGPLRPHLDQNVTEGNASEAMVPQEDVCRSEKDNLETAESV